MISSKYISAISGATFVIDTELAFVTILGVKREGLGVKEMNDPLSSPTGNEFKYTNTGRLDFDTSIPFNSGETVFVLYKY